MQFGLCEQNILRPRFIARINAVSSNENDEPLL